MSRLDVETAGDELAGDQRADALSLVLREETRPAISYEQARAILPALDALAKRAAELRGWLTYVIEQDCAANGRAEVRIGNAIYTYKGERVYALDDAAELHRELAAAVIRGELSRDELDVAVWPVDVPARVEWRVHNGRLNDLAKRGGAVAAAISAHRVESTAPAKLKPKGR